MNFFGYGYLVTPFINAVIFFRNCMIYSSRFVIVSNCQIDPEDPSALIHNRSLKIFVQSFYEEV